MFIKRGTVNINDQHGMIGECGSFWIQSWLWQRVYQRHISFGGVVWSGIEWHIYILRHRLSFHILFGSMLFSIEEAVCAHQMGLTLQVTLTSAEQYASWTNLSDDEEEL